MTTEPIDQVAALERASALCDMQRWDEAAGRLRTILASDPHNEEGLCLLAQAQIGQAAHDQALRSSLAAISESPNNEWPYRLASLAFSGLGRDQESRAMAREAVRLAPESAECHIMLAQQLVSSGPHGLLVSGGPDLPEARAAADRAVSLAPHNAGSHIAAGIVAASDARTHEATTAFHRALALEPDNSAAHNELSRLQLKTNRFGNVAGLAQAAGGFATALRADPRAGASRDNLDLVLHLFLGRTGFGIMVVAWFASRVATQNNVGLVRLLPAFLLVFPAFFAARFVSRLPQQLRGYLKRRLHDPFIASALACDAMAAGALVVGAASQPASRIAFWSAFAFSMLALLIQRLESHRKFHWAIDPNHRVSTAFLLAPAAVLWLVAIIAVYGTMKGSGNWGPVKIVLGVALGVTLGTAVYIRRRRGK